jgi:hypothetical protein
MLSSGTRIDERELGQGSFLAFLLFVDIVFYNFIFYSFGG